MKFFKKAVHLTFPPKNQPLFFTILITKATPIILLHEVEFNVNKVIMEIAIKTTEADILTKVVNPTVELMISNARMVVILSIFLHDSRRQIPTAIPRIQIKIGELVPLQLVALIQTLAH